MFFFKAIFYDPVKKARKAEYVGSPAGGFWDL